MANRRMFAKSITNSSQFLMMPQSSQNLYFHFGMNADDDGFCEHFAIMRMTDSKPDDLKVLSAKGYVKVFDDRVLVITEWKENNYIQSDRYTPSKYLKIYKEELKELSSGIQDVSKMDTQVRLGKDRKGKDRDTIAIAGGNEVNIIIDLFKPLNPSFERIFKNTSERAAIERMIKSMGVEKLRGSIEFAAIANGMPYAPTITTPLELERNLGKLIAFYNKEKGKENKITSKIAWMPTK